MCWPHTRSPPTRCSDVDHNATPARACPNCDSSLALEPPPRYCTQCGQIVRPLAPRAFVRDAARRYARSLVALIAHPGKLTSEFIAGRRERYLPPLRMYLMASFLFFLLIKVLSSPGGSHIVVAPAMDSQGKRITETSDPVAYRAAIAEAQACVDKPGSCSWSKTLGARIAQKGAAQSRRSDAVAQQMLDLAPTAVFVLLPVFAGLVMLAYRSRRMRYGLHFVFSLHMHAFGFLALLVLWKLPDSDVADLAAGLVFAGYGLWALHRVYGGRWWVTLGRAAALLALYLPVLFAVIVGLSIASLFLA
jgi:Protein of unknown function (DUF3667)